MAAGWLPFFMNTSKVLALYSLYSFSQIVIPQPPQPGRHFECLPIPAFQLQHLIQALFHLPLRLQGPPVLPRSRAAGQSGCGLQANGRLFAADLWQGNQTSRPFSRSSQCWNS